MRKLTDSDKQEILKLYRETAETTSTLAERYDVSNSTISRLLKSTLPEDEYEYLVSLKRAARTPEGRAQVSYEQLPLLSQLEPSPELPSNESPRLKLPVKQQEPIVEIQTQQEEAEEDLTSANRRVKRRSSATEKPKLKSPKQLELVEEKPPEIVSIPSPILEDERPEATVVAQMLVGEDLLDESEDLDDLEEDDLEEDDLDEDYDDEEEDDDYLDEPRPLVTRRRLGEIPVQVLPLSAASLPKTCYLVIDRASELITRPLRDFGDLGQIPNLETQQRTLPVFDNHRVAKRFSTKRDRVIKVPDSKMLHKARTHLQAKGITRLLIDGQVYSLSTV
ncbi:transposase [Nostocaceae cyanobacterium CENA369]|uniref:Transposase n=1 Tax=Dendronalium phyllosphericum CENA369 TaxID=1725256 RepID=A0A8J7LE36_9NOST|nr:transposase [Dendronalium phyllosphericum]MBH8572623.1 transposase [Dendronalium phyllosphericum CENA369]